MRVLRQFHHPLIYVLLAAGAITAGAGGVRRLGGDLRCGGDQRDRSGFIQESKAEAALEGLRSLVRTQATVVRDGHAQDRASDELVPGDLVLLEAGDKVPADLRLTRVPELRVNESALTGESVPVAKDEVVLPEAIAGGRPAQHGLLGHAGHQRAAAPGSWSPPARRPSWGRSTGWSAAAETPGDTADAEARRVQQDPDRRDPRPGGRDVRVGLLRGQDAVETFTAAVALAVGAIPEGLPAAVTITLAIGVARMARRRGGDPPAARGGDAGQHHGHLLGQDRHPHREPDDRADRVDPRWPVRGHRLGLPPGRRHARHRRAAPVSVDADQALRWSLLAGAGCNDAALTRGRTGGGTSSATPPRARC